MNATEWFDRENMHCSTEQKHAAKSVISGLNGTPILTLDKIRIHPWKRIQDNLGF